MDYIPPERPALIAQARDKDRRAVYKIVDTGQIDQMDQFDDFDEVTTSFQDERVRQDGLKPGQYFPLCKAEDNQLTFYVQEHKSCSVPTFAAFRALTKLNPVNLEQPFLSDKQLGLVKEILGDKLDKTKCDLNARINDVGGRKVLDVITISKTKPTIVGNAFFVVSDAKSHVIEEVGYKGARKDDKYWLDEARSMLASIKFVKEDAAKTGTPEFKSPSHNRK